jgi:HEAT repeat protein
MDEKENLQSRIQELILQLQNEDKNVQRNAAKALETIGMLAVPDLIKAVKSYKYLAEGRCHSVAILDNIAVDNPGNPILKQFISTFITALGDVDWGVRQASVEALRKIGYPAIPTLIEVLKNKESDEFERAGCVLALQIMTEECPDNEFVKNMVSTFIDALDDHHLEVRRSAAESLGKIGDLSAVPALIEVLNCEDWNIQTRYIQALRKILGKCKTIKSLEELESKLQEGYDRLKKTHKKEDLLKAKKLISRFKMAAAKKRNELAEERGILLDDKPKPPRRGKIYSSMGKKARIT